MSTFDTLIGLASLGIDISVHSKVEEIRQQGAASARAQEIINELRNEIFRFSEAAKDALALEARSPKMAAGGLQLLKARLDSSGLVPDIFPELSDKEFVSNTFRTIRENLSRILGALTSQERSEIDTMVDRGSRLPDYEFYIETYPTVIEYRGALKKSKAAPKAMAQTQKVTFTAGLGLSVLMGGAAFCALSTSSGGAGETFSFIVVGLILAVIGFAWLRSVADGRLKAYDTVERIQVEVDLGWFDELDNEFGGDLGQVKQLLAEATAALEGFFSPASMGSEHVLP